MESITDRKPKYDLPHGWIELTLWIGIPLFVRADSINGVFGNASGTTKVQYGDVYGPDRQTGAAVKETPQQVLNLISGAGSPHIVGPHSALDK